jgi:pimeloyl-ACP methyl ester carboxylesterase
MQLKSMLATAATSAMSTVERKFLCSDGITLASVCYRSTSAVTPPISNSSTRNVLCLHGWLDNSASFHIMAPELVRRGLAANVVALDSPGHGMSSHKSPDCPQLLADYVFYVAEVAKQLEWDKFTVVGHSMGAAVSVMFASCFPERWNHSSSSMGLHLLQEMHTKYPHTFVGPWRQDWRQINDFTLNSVVMNYHYHHHHEAVTYILTLRWL